MDVVEVRELGYFLVVAEEQHIGRAAARLGITQPPLSRAIKKLERRVGVPLLEADGRGVRITAAGEVLADEARKVLDAATAAAVRTRRAGAPERRIVLAMKADAAPPYLAEVLERYAELPDSVGVDLRVCGIGEQATLLRTGEVDVALLHLPFDDVSGFDTEPLSVADQVAVLPAGHRLAERTSLRLRDLRDEPMPHWPGQDGEGPELHDAAQLMQLIALGRAVAVLPATVEDNLRRGLVTVPVGDADQVTTLIGWPERTRWRAVSDLVRTAVDVAAEHRRGDTANVIPFRG